MTLLQGNLGVRGKIRRLLAGLALTGACVTLLACQTSLELAQPLAPPTISVVPVATVASSVHGVAIIGVDFDPPLDYAQIISNGGVTLLVALKNLGRAAEPYTEVQVRLLDSAAGTQSATLLDETLIVRSLAAGEVRVVRFNQVTDLPLRKHYALEIELGPVPGEQDLGDNLRSYDILVHGGE